MPDMELEKITGVKFSDLFGADDETISMERVEAFLNRVVNLAAEHAETSPNQLVRVVHHGKVLWMTHKQASEYLKKSQEPDIQQEVEKALKGGVKYIRQELEILLAIAFYTIRKFKEKNLIPAKEIERIEPQLKRRQKEISAGISCTYSSETVLAEKRRKNPLIEEYEFKMGEFLNVKSQGNMQNAMELAKELNAKKKKYLLLVRSIEPDVRTIYYHRLNLQKTKKRILGTQSDLCLSRKDLLEFEMKDLQNNLDSVKDNLDMAEEEGLDSAASEIKRLRQFDMGSVEEELNDKKGELQALERESEFLERQEKETDAVIDHIAENVLQEQDLKFDMSDVVKQTQKPLFQNENQAQFAQEKQKSSGMHSAKRRD